MAHTCSTLVLHCIDFRFGSAITEYLEKNGLANNCDVVSVAGAAKNIASPTKDSDREFVLRQIEISKRLHDIKEVVLMNHTDCGAYGGRSAFPSRAEEEKTHFAEMQKAASIIRERFPDIEIKLVLANIEESEEIHFDILKLQTTPLPNISPSEIL